MSDKNTLVNPLFNMTEQQIVNYCDERGKQFAKNVTTSQLRNVFSKIVSIRTYYTNPKTQDINQFYSKLKRDITLLKPRLAYATARDERLKEFYKDMVILIDITINSIDNELQQKGRNEFRLITLDNFFNIVEGFVAYHKYYGGK